MLSTNNREKEFILSLQLEGKRRLSADNLFSLLENILVLGSISKAASELGVSYRYAWGLLEEAEKALDMLLVEKKVGGYEGGGAVLTSKGKELLEQYKGFKREVDSQLSRFLASSLSRDEEEKSLEEGKGMQHLLLATTMETVETGLLDVLEQAYYRRSGVLVRHIPVGSGRALEIAKDGRVDMVLTHAPQLEEKFMKDGWGVFKKNVMYNNFWLVGPNSDPACLQHIKEEAGVTGLFRQIALTQKPFISRGDQSGTHLREQEIWQKIGINPGGEWYLESPGVAGNLGILKLAQEKEAYTLVDAATFLLARCQEKMTVYAGNDNEKKSLLTNVFSLILVNPYRFVSVKYDDAMDFALWLTEGEGKEIIASFGTDTFEEPLFKVVE